ncbi:MAG: hypothetical protein GYA34_15560, partial [Chloroflexi bacterium]|nr:hypothetical protein [Chloroflexota bacterium]
KQAGFPPLQGEWRPDWGIEQSDMVAEALEARRELGVASDTPNQSEELPNNRVIRTSPKDRLRETIVDVISDRAIDMNEAGQDGSAYYKSYTEVAFGEATLLTELRKRAFQAALASNEARPRVVLANVRARSKAARDYVLARAAGKCESYKNLAPFFDWYRQLYLEEHHIYKPRDDVQIIALWSLRCVLIVTGRLTLEWIDQY